MLKFQGSRNLHRVVVLNPKGGSGKSTLAFNIAGYLAGTGRRVALVDMDVQGSCSHWLKSRGEKLPYIHSVTAPYESSRDGSTEQIVKIPPEYDFAVIDAPGSVAAEDLSDFTVGAHAILIPVVPSAFDIHAASRLIKDLLLVARVSRTKGRLGIVANRIRVRTLSYRRLQTFLDSLSIAVVGKIRDSQNYVQAAYKGLCIHEMAHSSVRSDLEQWQQIANWIEDRLTRPLTERDWYRPQTRKSLPREPAPVPERRVALLTATAAVLAAVTFAFLLWQVPLSDSSPTTADSAVAQPDAAPQTIEHVSDVATVMADAPAPRGGAIARAVGDGQTIESGALHNEPNPHVPGIDSEPDVRAQFREKWQLSGVAQSDGDSIVLLSQRDDATTHRIRTGTELDGWTVKDAGPDYAVFARNDSEVRLVLHEQRTD